MEDRVSELKRALLLVVEELNNGPSDDLWGAAEDAHKQLEALLTELAGGGE